MLKSTERGRTHARPTHTEHFPSATVAHAAAMRSFDLRDRFMLVLCLDLNSLVSFSRVSFHLCAAVKTAKQEVSIEHKCTRTTQQLVVRDNGQT